MGKVKDKNQDSRTMLSSLRPAAGAVDRRRDIDPADAGMDSRHYPFPSPKDGRRAHGGRPVFSAGRVLWAVVECILATVGPTADGRAAGVRWGSR